MGFYVCVTQAYDCMCVAQGLYCLCVAQAYALGSTLSRNDIAKMAV